MPACSRLAISSASVAALERAPAGEELVEHEAERVDVAPRRDLAAGELLGRHVGRRAGAQRLRRPTRRQAEVGDADPAAAVEHDVRRLQIAMEHAAVVRGGESRADLPRELERALLRESGRCGAAATRDLRRRRTPSTGRCAPRPRRCRRRGRRSGATPAAPSAPRCAAASSRAGSAIDLLGQELQRDRLTELEVVGAIDLAHPAPAEAPDDAIAGVEQGAGREPAVVDRVGARQPAAALRRGLRVPRTNGGVADRCGHMAIGTRQTCHAGRPREGRCTTRADFCAVRELGGAGRTSRHRL